MMLRITPLSLRRNSLPSSLFLRTLPERGCSTSLAQTSFEGQAKHNLLLTIYINAQRIHTISHKMDNQYTQFRTQSVQTIDLSSNQSQFPLLFLPQALVISSPFGIVLSGNLEQVFLSFSQVKPRTDVIVFNLVNVANHKNAFFHVVVPHQLANRNNRKSEVLLKLPVSSYKPQGSTCMQSLCPSRHIV